MLLSKHCAVVWILAAAGGAGFGGPVPLDMGGGSDSDGDIDPLRDVPKSDRQKRKDKLRKVRDKEAVLDARKRKKEGEFEVGGAATGTLAQGAVSTGCRRVHAAQAWGRPRCESR